MASRRRILGGAAYVLLFGSLMFLGSCLAEAAAYNAYFQPIIGIIAQDRDALSMEIESTYVKFVEAGGGRVAPILLDMSDDEITELFGRMNGVLFPGGDTLLHADERFYQIIQLIFNLAIQANDRGDYFPIWGTCLGFEALVQLVVNNYTILDHSHFDDENVIKTVDWVNDLQLLASSKLLNLCAANSTENKQNDDPTASLMCSTNLFLNSARLPFAQYNHEFGVSLKDWHDNPKLGNFFHMLATGTSTDNQTFVAVIESKQYPFYGVQFHPEKNLYMFSPVVTATHSLYASQFTQYFANFMVNEARKNHHRFVDFSAEYEHMIFRYTPVLVQASSEEYDFRLNYIFPRKSSVGVSAEESVLGSISSASPSKSDVAAYVKLAIKDSL